MELTPDWIVGRPFEMNHYVGNTIAGRLLLTAVAWDPKKGIRMHESNGAREWWSLRDVRRLLEAGQLVEGEHAPFVLDRAPAFRRKGAR